MCKPVYVNVELDALMCLMFLVHIGMAVIAINCMELSVCRVEIGNYPSYRGNSAKIS